MTNTDDMNDIVSLGMIRDEQQVRIEELEAELAYWKKDSAAAWDKCEDYRLKLAKAVKLGLEECPFWDGSGAYNDWWHDRRTTLKELTGDNEVKGGKDE